MTNVKTLLIILVAAFVLAFLVFLAFGLGGTSGGEREELPGLAIAA